MTGCHEGQRWTRWTGRSPGPCSLWAVPNPDKSKQVLVELGSGEALGRELGAGVGARPCADRPSSLMSS